MIDSNASKSVIKTELIKWTKGVRLYVFATGVVIIIATYFYVLSAYTGTTVRQIRFQQLLSLWSVIYLYLALLIGPVCSLIKNKSVTYPLYDARRMLGINAFIVGLLHGVVALFGQLGGVGSLAVLPDIFKISIAIGALALLILAAMVSTSFDKAIARMGIWWFRLHRLVYIAGVAILVHALLIGTHTKQLGVGVPRITIIMVGILLGLHIVQYVRKAKQTVFGYTVLALFFAGYVYFVYLSVTRPFNGLGINDQNSTTSRMLK